VPGRGGARAALREAGKEAGERLARQGAKQAVSNRMPSRIKRVKVSEEKNPATITHLGRPDASDVFVTAASDIRRIKTSRGLARKLTLIDEQGRLRVGRMMIIEFDTPQGIASPVFRDFPGFVGRGRTAGGAREFVVPNYSLEQLQPLNPVIRFVE